MKRFYTYFDGAPAVGLLFLRLFVGGVFVFHGLSKIQNPFHWADKMGIPGILQALAALAEFGGGLALIVGLLTPLACLGIMSTMVVACMVLKKGGAAFLSPAPKNFELPALYFVIALALLLTGPGKLSLDATLFAKKGR